MRSSIDLIVEAEFVGVKPSAPAELADAEGIIYNNFHEMISAPSATILAATLASTSRISTITASP